jgi:hypothetical protein
MVKKKIKCECKQKYAVRENHVIIGFKCSNCQKIYDVNESDKSNNKEK